MQMLSKRLDNLLKYLVAAILIAIPLYPKFPLFSVPQTFVAVRWEDLLVAFSALVWFIYYLPKLKLFLDNKIVKSLGLYILVALVSLTSAVFVLKSVVVHIGILHLVRRVEYFVPFLLGYSVIKKDKSLAEFYFKILVLVLFFVFIYGLGQRYLGWPIVITQNQEYSKGVALTYIEGSHINSTFAGHYDLATFLILILPIIIACFFIFKDKVLKAVLGFSWLSGLWLLVNTASRISLVSYLGSAVLALILIKKYRAIPLVILVSLSFILFSSNLQARYERLIEIGTNGIQKIVQVKERMYVYAAESLPEGKQKLSVSPQSSQENSQDAQEDRSTSIRLNVEWPRAIRAFLKNPLLGTGYSSITLASDNDYLRSLGETGILGLSAFLLIFVNIILLFLRKYPFGKNFRGIELAIIVGYFSAIPGLLLNAFFIDIFEASKFAILFWMVSGISVSLL